MIKREFRCFFEGQQEEMYFAYFGRKVREIYPNISLKFKKVAKLITLEKMTTDVPKLAVFDFDLNKQKFEKKVKICNNTRILYSNLNFDLWLLLHKEQFRRNVQTNDAYVDLVRSNYNLAANANIKTKSSMDKILGQIEIKDIKNAVKNAEEIMNDKLETDKIYVKRNFSYYHNPSMSINEFFKELFKDLRI